MERTFEAQLLSFVVRYEPLRSAFRLLVLPRLEAYTLSARFQTYIWCLERINCVGIVCLLPILLAFFL